MDGDKENAREVSEASIQLAVKESSSDHLPENSRVVKENGDPDDGAEEKLVAEDGALKTNKDASEVKFISSDSQNGDAKIDIENLKIAFVGMGKEELMKFANDPFWVRLRWFLFILFWLLWAGMLAGAIAIIVMAPKCAAPAPLKWWEQSPLYQVFLPSFKDGSEPQNGIGDIKGLQSKIEYIKGLGVKGISLSSVLKATQSSSADEAVEDFEDIDPQYGILSEFKELLGMLKNKGIHLLLSLVPNHSSIKHPWFVKSEKNDTQYKDYYIWSPGKTNSSGNPVPPNNWLSLNGGPAWKWSSIRKEFYLHQFHSDEPDLNFRNPSVIDEFKNVFKFWLNLGVSGFQLEKIEYLLEDQDLKDEAPLAPIGTYHTQYEYYSHFKTTNQHEIVNILADWKTSISNYSEGEGVLSVSGKLSNNLFYENQNNTQVVDLLQTNSLFLHLKEDFTAKDLIKLLQTYQRNHPNETRQTWQLSTMASSRIPSRLSPDYVDALNMVAMLLPGTPITLYGEELGMDDASVTQKYPGRCAMSWNNSSNAGFTSISTSKYPPCKNYEEANVAAEQQSTTSSLAVYKDLVTARNTPSIMYGALNYTELNSGTVFAFTRIKSGNPGYLVAFNTADTDVTVSFNKMQHVPEELNVQILSSNFNTTNIKVKTKLGRDNVHMSARSALVVTFVPKME